jgi:hypothetical protein
MCIKNTNNSILLHYCFYRFCNKAFDFPTSQISTLKSIDMSAFNEPVLNDQITAEIGLINDSSSLELHGLCERFVALHCDNVELLIKYQERFSLSSFNIIWEEMLKADAKVNFFIFRNPDFLGKYVAIASKASNHVQSSLFAYIRSAIPEIVSEDALPIDESSVIGLDYLTIALSNENLELAETARVHLEGLAKTHCKIIIRNLVSSCRNVATNNVFILRYYAVIAKITTYSDDHFFLCRDSSLIDQLIAFCMSTDDILAQINVVELLVEVASTSAGVGFIVRNPIFRWLFDLIDERVAAFPILVDTALRTLAAIFRKLSDSSKDIFTIIDSASISSFLSSLEQHLEDRDETRRVIGTYFHYPCSYPLVQMDISMQLHNDSNYSALLFL